MERILVVDDEPEACSVLEDFLTLRGFEVQTANDGAAALACVSAFRPHVVLLDIIMPGMDGMEVLEALRAREDPPGVIMVTAVADQDLGNRALTMGASDYITKPVDLNYLETVVLIKIIDLVG